MQKLTDYFFEFQNFDNFFVLAVEQCLNHLDIIRIRIPVFKASTIGH
jgi:hypothetical protein